MKKKHLSGLFLGHKMRCKWFTSNVQENNTKVKSVILHRYNFAKNLSMSLNMVCEKETCVGFSSLTILTWEIRKFFFNFLYIKRKYFLVILIDLRKYVMRCGVLMMQRLDAYLRLITPRNTHWACDANECTTHVKWCNK